MTDRELMQDALDALTYVGDKDIYSDTIDALRARLAQPEQEQEPVAWIHNFIDGGFTKSRPNDLDRYPDRWTALYKDPTPCQTCEALARTVMMDQTSHDTKREWVGLTDEEYEAMAENHVTNCYFDTLTYARAVETKLKEKNHG